VHADRRGGAVISQPYRPDATVALPDRTLGDLLGEELRRLDPDEPFADALEATTGVPDLTYRSPVREYVWFDPAEENAGSGGETLPAVPPDSEGTDEVAEQGVDDPDQGARDAGQAVP
jgi:hypothetical protein